MAKFFRSILFVAAVMMFAACSNPSGGDNPLNQIPESSSKSKVTLTYDKNQPGVNGSISYLVDKAIPESEEHDEGSIVTAAEFTGKLVKYENLEEVCKYSFVEWNTKPDGTGLVFKAGDSFILEESRVLYAIYSNVSDADDKVDNAGPLNFRITQQYKINVGDEVSLVSEMDGIAVYYEAQGSDDVVEVSGNTIKALAVGIQIVDVYSLSDFSKLGSCSFEVTVEASGNNAIELNLIGKWNYEDNLSYLKFNANKTGEMLVYLNGDILQECTFNWSAYTVTNGTSYLNITDGAEYINKTYEISLTSADSLKLTGYLAAFTPKVTNWTRE